MIHEVENNNYLHDLIKNDIKFIYIKYIINNVNINNFDKIFNNHITNHNKKFYYYYINCEFIIETNNRLLNLEINYNRNTDYVDLRCYLFFYTESQKIKNFKINKMIINTFSCLCNMTYKYYLNQPMSMLERRINYNIAMNPLLINSLDRNKNHHLIRKNSHIPFKIL